MTGKGNVGCVGCGGPGPLNHYRECGACAARAAAVYGYDPDDVYDDGDGDGAEPIGSCDECDSNLYPGDDWGGLCSSCAWHARQGRYRGE